MKLIVGLGNIGHNYQMTRHNVGFMMLDAFAREMNAEFIDKQRFFCDVAEVDTLNEKVLLIKPTTYYNESGRAASTIANFYKIGPDNILVVHDELALPFGTIRTRSGGSDAGNNGVKSITQNIGEQYARIRIGVYSELRDRMQDADYVLSKFTADEQHALSHEVTAEVSSMIHQFVQETFSSTTVELT